MSENRSKIDISARRISADWPKVGYDKRHTDFYNKDYGTTKTADSMFFGKKLADIFIYAMALGKKSGLPGLDYESKSDRKESIDYEYIAINPSYMWMMITIAIEEAEKNGDEVLKIFENPKERIIDVCERYANRGIKELIDIDSEARSEDPLIGYERKFRELINIE